MKIIVYLRSADEHALEAEGHDPAQWVRDAVKHALSERGRNAGANPVRAEDVSPGRPAAQDTPRSESATFKGPDPKPGKKK